MPLSPVHSADKSPTRPHTVVELRQYTLHPGQRDVLIDLFDSNFIESQEEKGMLVVGQFRDLDNPDRFVWVRSFADMPTRAAALTAFYTGPVWKAHGRAAASTMIDASNVLLLRPARADAGFASAALPPRSARGTGHGLITASIIYMHRRADEGFEEFFEKELKPQWEGAGSSVLAQLVTEDQANTYPALSVREGERVFVWFSRFADRNALDRHARTLAASPQWRALAVKFGRWTYQPIEILRLEPTARSRLHGR